MVEIRPYKFEDAMKLEPKEEGVKNKLDYETWARMNEMGPAYTIIVDGEIIACAGIRIFWEGSGEAWSILSKENSSKYIRLIMETFGKRLKFVVEKLKFRWVQVSINSNNDKGIHFAQHFGFKRKCEMKGYLPDGSDAFLYALEIEL